MIEDEHIVHELIQVSDGLRHDLMDNIISPFYRELITNTLKAKTFYKHTGMALETSSKIFVAIGSILSFSTGYYDDDNKVLSVCSGSIGCLSLGLMQVAAFSYKEHLRLSKELNAILHKLRIETLPIMNRSVTDATDEPRQRRASVVAQDLDERPRRGSVFEEGPFVIC